MSDLPKDCHARVIGAEAWKLVHYKFPSKNWEYHEQTGRDNGLDCVIELVENEEWNNKKIEGQIKGTMNPNLLKDDKSFSCEISTKTVLYGLSSSIAFVIFYVDVKNESVYYLPLQDYFISNPKNYEKLEKNRQNISIHIPIDNIVSNDDFDLQQIAKSTYVDGPSRKLRKV